MPSPRPPLLAPDNDPRFTPPVLPIVRVVRLKWDRRPPPQLDANGIPIVPPDETVALVTIRMWIDALKLGSQALGLLVEDCFAVELDERLHSPELLKNAIRVP